ncbi:MAG: thioredoxin-dependent thiol peroxidase [Chloroflexi bacterium]|nr:thioredoxin-dependent thiol peroxidase [Chloroflexota bacterium]
MLDVGDKAPDFTLPASNGKNVSLKELAGKKVVIYFYPKDNTPGCTREACSLRDYNADIQKAGAVVLGVSKDSVDSHNKFISKYKLPFVLLSDPDAKMAAAYGAWGEKVLYGRKFMGMKRITYLIDEKGKVAQVWGKVKPDNHGEEVLAAIKGK